MPFFIVPKDPSLTLEEIHISIENNRSEVKYLMEMYGALLFRKCGVKETDHFASILSAILNSHPVPYLGGDGPRTKVDIENHVYKSSDAPPSQKIDLHEERSYTQVQPDYIAFFCKKGTPAWNWANTFRIN